MKKVLFLLFVVLFLGSIENLYSKDNLAGTNIKPENYNLNTTTDLNKMDW